VFENRILNRVLVSKQEKMAGGWRTLHNAEFHSEYSSTDIIRVIKEK